MFFDLTAHDVDEFVGDGLLTGLIVEEGEFFQQVVGIVIGCLHGKHTGCVFACDGIEQCAVHLYVQHLGVECIGQFLWRRLCQVFAFVGGGV